MDESSSARFVVAVVPDQSLFLGLVDPRIRDEKAASGLSTRVTSSLVWLDSANSIIRLASLEELQTAWLARYQLPRSSPMKATQMIGLAPQLPAAADRLVERLAEQT